MHAIATSDNAFVLRPRCRLPARLLRLARDERLVEQVRAGSTTAFDVVFDRHHRGVLAFCRHMLGSVEEAEDAVQHTFMAAHRVLAHSAQTIELRPWLYAVARNRCLSMLRARRELPVEEVAEPATENLAVVVQRREDLRELLRDLSGLPEEQRAALVLTELGDVPHDEIALVLGCERAKVKALVFQARTSLHASRTARETSCVQIREQLANLHGGALRRNALRRHLRDCPGCREFRKHVRTQRRALAIVLPVAPSVGLKEAVLGAAVGGAGAVGTAAGTAGVVGTAGTFAAKALVVATVAGGGATAGVKTIDSPSAPAAAAREAVIGEPLTVRPPAPLAGRSSRAVQKSAAKSPVSATAGRTRASEGGEVRSAPPREQRESEVEVHRNRHDPVPEQAGGPPPAKPPPPVAAAPPAAAEVDQEPAPEPEPQTAPPPPAPEPTPAPTTVPTPEPAPVPPAEPTPEPAAGGTTDPADTAPVVDEPVPGDDAAGGEETGGA